VAESNVEITRRALGYFNSGDREALRELTAESAEIVPLRAALEGTVYRGENAFDEFWAAIDETWEFVRMEAEEIVDHGGRVLIVGRLQGRAKGTEVDVDSPMAWVMTVNDERKMTSMRTYTNIAQARRDAGLAE
jgi:ketosteroid isomerase-like protein